MAKMTLTKVNGEGKVNGKVSKAVLKRNVMDIITGWDWDFDDCDDRCDEATAQELMDFIRDYDQAENYEEVLKNFMAGY